MCEVLLLFLGIARAILQVERGQGTTMWAQMINKSTILKITALLTLITLSLIGCGPSADSRYDSGYSDGYAEGYNTECKIRATLVEGDWKDKDYSRGYQDGRVDGVAACRAGK